MRQAHLRDAAALANFWAWLEKLIVQEKKAISEVRVLGLARRAGCTGEKSNLGGEGVVRVTTGG
jgi:hypothetical protein